MPSTLRNQVARASIAAIFLILAAGCSMDHPLSPSSTDSGNGSGSPLTDIEFSTRVATTDPPTRSLTFTDRPETAVAAEDAEIVRKIDGNEVPITFEEIMVGDSVDVRGVPQGDGTLLADRIRVRSEGDNGPEVELYGRVDTIDPDVRTMTLVNDPTLITVLLSAEIVNADTQTPIALSDISPDDSVEVRGYMQGDGSLEANRVRLRTGVEDNYDVEFESYIVAIDYNAGSFMVEGRTETIFVDAATVIHSDHEHGPSFSPDPDGSGDDDSRGGTLMSFDDLQVGDFVEVKANIVNPTTLLAVVIELEDDEGEIEFKAVLASVDVSTRVVTFEGRSEVGNVLEDAQLENDNGDPLTLADFSAGDIVEVRGFESQSGEFMIDRMHKDDSL